MVITYVLARAGTSQQDIDGYIKQVTAKYAEPQMKEIRTTASI